MTEHIYGIRKLISFSEFLVSARLCGLEWGTLVSSDGIMVLLRDLECDCAIWSYYICIIKIKSVLLDSIKFRAIH